MAVVLKKIRVDELRLGMFVERVDGSWLAHPFWRNRFAIAGDADLQALRTSGVEHCWIDASRGVDVAAPLPPVARAVREPEQPPAPTRLPRDELERASAICRQAGEQMRGLFDEVRLGRAIDAERCLPLVSEITDSVFRNGGALLSLARLKHADNYSYLHSVAVCALMVALARQLGLPSEQCREAGLAGLLHDVGKALIPLELLNKPGKLSDDEFTRVKAHPTLGHELLVRSGCSDAGALEVCLHHHERIDGRGYPHALAGDAVPLLSRMGALCDVYDAITSNRPYKAGWDPGDSIARMASWQGHFDPALLKAFVRAVGIYPDGSLVQLKSGRVAVVVSQTASSLAAPQVLAFYSTRSQMPITPRRIDLSRSAERIVAREPATTWSAAQIEQLWRDAAMASAT